MTVAPYGEAQAVRSIPTYCARKAAVVPEADLAGGLRLRALFSIDHGKGPNATTLVKSPATSVPWSFADAIDHQRTRSVRTNALLISFCV